MEQTVTGIVEKPADAQRIIDELTAHCQCDRSDISLMAGENAGRGPGVVTRAARATSQVAATAGNAVAATLGGIVGAASAVSSRPLSGFGVLSAVGQLGAVLTRTALTTGEDLVKAFVEFGMGSDLARDYAEALRRGHIVLIVNAKTDNMARCARKVMATYGATAEERTPN
jgi:hypothetical protein